MKTRELTVAEINMVSGAKQNWCLRETYDNFIKGINSFVERANAIDNTKEWYDVVAANETIKGEFEAFTKDYGFSAQRTLDSWIK